MKTRKIEEGCIFVYIPGGTDKEMLNGMLGNFVEGIARLLFKFKTIITCFLGPPKVKLTHDQLRSYLRERRL
jgi:hypothetical protein